MYTDRHISRTSSFFISQVFMCEYILTKAVQHTHNTGTYTVELFSMYTYHHKKQQLNNCDQRKNPAHFFRNVRGIFSRHLRRNALVSGTLTVIYRLEDLEIQDNETPQLVESASHLEPV